MNDLTAMAVQRRDLPSQRWEVWMWDAHGGAVVEECDTFDELVAANHRALDKAKKYLTLPPDCDI